MNKRILYGLIFTSIFIVSTVSVATQPVFGANWKLGIPEQAKGMSTESEVKIYDKEAWGEHLGYDFGDKCSEIHGGDASSVGARSKTKVNDFEGEDIDMFSDHIMTIDVPIDEQGKPLEFMGNPLTDYWSAVELADSILEDIAFEDPRLKDDPVDLNITILPSVQINASIGAAEYCGPVSQLEILTKVLYDIYLDDFPAPGVDTSPFNFGNNSIAGGSDSDNWHPDAPMQIVNLSDYLQWKTSVGILNKPESISMFGKAYKGTEIDIDFWDFVKEGDYDSNPDENDWIRPILKDPHAYYDLYKQFVAYLSEQLRKVDELIRVIEDIRTRFQNAQAGSMGGGFALWQNGFWLAANMSIDMAIEAMYNLSLPENANKLAMYQDIINASGPWANDLVDLYLDALLNATGDNPLQIYAGFDVGLNYVNPFIRDIVPLQKKEFLAELFQNGIFAYQPVDKYLQAIIDDFDIDDDAVWGDDWTINGITADDALHRGGIKVEGKIVTVEYEWVGAIFDTADGIIQIENEMMVPLYKSLGVIPMDATPRKDYEVIYTYGDTGGQISVEYVGSDESFYRIEGIAPLIPGYEIPILLASAAISALALIYVVMKKKRM